MICNTNPHLPKKTFCKDRLHPDAQHREGTARQLDGENEVIGSGAGGLDELLDLSAGNEDFPQGLAGRQKTPRNEPSYAFCAAIQQGGSLVYVAEQRLGQRLILAIQVHRFSFVSRRGIAFARLLSEKAVWKESGRVSEPSGKSSEPSECWEIHAKIMMTGGSDFM